MSPTSSAPLAPRLTARAWCSISSMVTESVLGWPRTTMASESPTRIASTPAASAARAVGKSYAVSMVMGSPRSHLPWRSRTVTLGRGGLASSIRPGPEDPGGSMAWLTVGVLPGSPPNGVGVLRITLARADVLHQWSWPRDATIRRPLWTTCGEGVERLCAGGRAAWNCRGYPVEKRVEKPWPAVGACGQPRGNLWTSGLPAVETPWDACEERAASCGNVVGKARRERAKPVEKSLRDVDLLWMTPP